MLQFLIDKFNTIEKNCIHRLIHTIDKVNERTDKTKKKKEKGRRRERKEKGGKDFAVKTSVQVNAIYQSVKQNYIFYIALLICVYAFTKCTYNKSKFFLSIFSLFFITFYGYFVHLVSHYMGTKISELYKTYDNIFTR